MQKDQAAHLQLASITSTDGQLGLFAPPAKRPALHVVNSPADTTAPSRTRLLLDAIRQALPGVRVVLTDNRTALLSQSRKKNGEREVRVHQMFLDADATLRLHIAHFLATGDKKSGRAIDAFITAQGHLLTLNARPLPHDAHVGQTHNLHVLYTQLNARYFGDTIDAELTWGQGPIRQKGRRKSITFGTYDHRARRITMHPALDQGHVPSLVVGRVLHHEMLHQKHGDERDAHGRRVVHGPAFRREEALFDGADAADAWLSRHLDALLRFVPT